MSQKSLLEERLESSQRDIGLIIADVKASDEHPVLSPDRMSELKSALNGMDTVIRDVSEIRTALAEALKAHDRIEKKTGVMGKNKKGGN